MVRVPETASLEWLIGQRKGDKPKSPELYSLTGPEVDRLIDRCAAALQSHGKDFHAGRDKENALVAFESAMSLLLEVRQIHTGKRAEIESVLVRFGYPIPEN